MIISWFEIIVCIFLIVFLQNYPLLAYCHLVVIWVRSHINHYSTPSEWTLVSVQRLSLAFFPKIGQLFT